ncbi:MAG: DUF2167 domain-containing protein [Pedosphaera sp.]|nr:DUF2167 domain-containing protein [Pedosphaera sp.]
MRSRLDFLMAHRLLQICLFWAVSLAVFGAEKPAAEKPAKDPLDRFKWLNGPATADLRSRARLRLPAGSRFVEAGDAQKILKLMGNSTHGNELGLVESRSNHWWAIFSFDEVGYVKDDEKKDLDADKLLKQMQEGVAEDNTRRKSQEIPTLEILGWHVAPNFNDETKNLEWSLLGQSAGEKFVNYNVRILGRKGVTEVTLIEDFDKVDAAMPGFRELLKSFQYSQGENYAEFRQGDKIAQYGLGALVLGGTAAAAYKLGFFGLVAGFLKKAFKFVIVGLVAIGAWIKKVLTGRKPGRSEL